MWDLVCDLVWSALVIDAASVGYYAWQWYGGPVAAVKGIWENGPEVVPLLKAGALAPIQALRLNRDLAANFDKIRQSLAPDSTPRTPAAAALPVTCVMGPEEDLSLSSPDLTSSGSESSEDAEVPTANPDE